MIILVMEVAPRKGSTLRQPYDESFFNRGKKIREGSAKFIQRGGPGGFAPKPKIRCSKGAGLRGFAPKAKSKTPGANDPMVPYFSKGHAVT